MVSIDTHFDSLKRQNSNLEFMQTSSGVEDVLHNISLKSSSVSERKDYRALTRISIKLDSTPLENVLTLTDIDSERCEIIANFISSSFQFYKASDVVDYSTRPVLLFYAMEHLAAACIFSRYKVNPNRRKGHGISQDGNSDILFIKKEGLFPLFVYSHNSTLNLGNNQINYKFLLNAYFTASNQRDHSLKQLAEREYGSNEEIQSNYKNSIIDELSTHYLLMFYFSNLSRYQINYWKKKLSPKSRENFLIRKFIEQSKESFPIYIFYKCFYKP